MENYLSQHYLDTSARNKPEEIAISCSNVSISKSELLKSSNKLANCLISENIKRQDRVVIYHKRSYKTIVALMGTIKADAIYVPVDPKVPIDRLDKIIKDCSPSAIICDKKRLKEINKIAFKNKIKVIVLGYKKKIAPIDKKINIVFQDLIDSQPDRCPDYRNIDTDLAYILYTSGTTGDPKGVMITHLNIVNYIEWAVSYFGIKKRDRILSTAPFHFDMSTFDIYASLKSGAALCIASEELLLFPSMLLRLIEKEKISIWKCISSLLMYIARAASLEKYKLCNLEKIIFSGERLPTKYLIEWMKNFPKKRFYNAYGPTEATGISTCYEIKGIPEDNSIQIPIGKPCKNTEVFILKADNTVAKKGEIGELCICGSCLSKGYWNDQEKTENKFFRYSSDEKIYKKVYQTGDLALEGENGEILFMGRNDSQVKYLGYRIELSEIENAILSNKKVCDAIVILYKNENNDIDQLVSFVEAGKDFNAEELLDELKTILPHYMIPSRIKVVGELPRTNRGKIDRKKIIEEIKKNYQGERDYAQSN